MVFDGPAGRYTLPKEVTVNEQELDAYVGRAPCDVVADDGTRCQRLWHSDEAHDFAEQGPAEQAVDGGRHWRGWITTVKDVRAALDGLPVPRAAGGPYRPDAQAMKEQHATALLRIATAVGMQGVDEEGVIVFRHPEGVVASNSNESEE